MANGRRWTPEEDAILRRDYRAVGTEAIYQRLAVQLNRTPSAVKVRTGALNICRKLTWHRQAWTEEQDDRLAELLGRYSPSHVATLMGRSKGSVMCRASQLGLSARLKDGWFNASEVAAVLGVEVHWVRRRIQEGSLKADTSGHEHRITDKQLREFIARYPGELQGRTVDMVTFVNLLTGAA